MVTNKNNSICLSIHPCSVSQSFVIFLIMTFQNIYTEISGIGLHSLMIFCLYNLIIVVVPIMMLLLPIMSIILT